MSLTRRGYLSSLTIGIAGGAFSTRRTAGASTASVTGEIESEVGASLDDSLIEFISPEAQIFKKVPIDDGTFDVNLEAEATFHVTFWHETRTGGYITEIDNVPLVQDLEQDLRIEGKEIDLGTYEIPEGHRVEVRFTDTNGSPVGDLHVGFRTSGGSGTGPEGFFTNSEGYVYSDSENNTGVELAGEISVEVLSPTDHTESITPRRLSVTDDEEVTIQLQSPEKWGGTIGDSASPEEPTAGTDSTSPTGEGTTESRDTDSASGVEGASSTDTRVQGTPQRESSASGDDRGFFTNRDSSIALLNDPVRLTWAGIVASILGITFQLLGDDS